MSITDADLEQLIEKISTEHGLDVRGYKRSTLCRRLRRRLADVGADSLEDYLVRLGRGRPAAPARGGPQRRRPPPPPPAPGGALYFAERPGGRRGARRDTPPAVLFGPHNVLNDPPISRLDLLVCRNLLIYFDSET